MVALPASLSAWSFPFTPACPGQYSPKSFQRWMSAIDTFLSWLPIPLFTFCCKSIDSVMMIWHVLSDCQCHLMRQSSRGHGWLLPPPLSRWKLRPYRLHCLHGWWLHLAWRWSLTLTGWWLSHQCALWNLAVYCFLEWEAWFLILFYLLASLSSTFPSSPKTVRKNLVVLVVHDRCSVHQESE